MQALRGSRALAVELMIPRSVLASDGASGAIVALITSIDSGVS